jgi:hypothetical protein
MKQVLLVALFFASASLSGQSSTITSTYHAWEWNEHECIYKWSVTFENNSNKSYSGVKFRLILRNINSGNIVYSKLHTVSIQLGPYEAVPSPKFRLAGEICGLDDMYNSLSEHHFDALIISAW